MERLDKIISQAGIASRRDVKMFVREGRILVDGVAAVSYDMKVDCGAVIMLDGERVEAWHPVTAVMNKPAGYVTSTDDPSSVTVMKLLPERYLRLGLYPVGRLDKDTTGLLIFTNDGTLAHRLISPKRNIEKEYVVTHTGEVTDEIIESFYRGLVLADGTECRSAVLTRISDGVSSLVITEGKYHQVKRMMGSVGLAVTQLRRVREGNLTLSGLAEGEMRELGDEEIAHLTD